MSSLAADGEGMPDILATRVSSPGVSLPTALQTFAFWRHPHAYLEWCRRRYGDTFTINSLGKPPLVFISAAHDIKTIVQAPSTVLHPGEGGAVIAPLVGAGSFMIAEEDGHLAGRRSILPALHHRLVDEHAEMVRETTTREVATWPLNAPVALQPHLRALTLRIILRTIFGHDDGCIGDLHARLLAMFSVTASLALHGPQLRRLPRWRSIWRSFLAARDEVDRIIASLIRDEVHARARNNGVLAMLLDSSCLANGGVRSGEIRDTLMSLILAGHETTAGELAWAFQLLAHDRAIANCLVDDLDRGGTAYLGAVIDEVLRHRPVFLFTIPRAVRRPFAVGATTYHPPAQLVGCIHLMHHDSSLYPQPHLFRPERFLGDAPTPETWMPWGGGRKRCPGHHLALLEMRTVLATVLSSLELRPVGRHVETARWRSVIVTPGRGCRIVMRKRPMRGHAGEILASQTDIDS
jgi:cytochrome P450